MERTYMVEYSIQDETIGKVMLTRKMNQTNLGKLLLVEGVTLSSVNKQPFYPSKSKKKA